MECWWAVPHDGSIYAAAAPQAGGDTERQVSYYGSKPQQVALIGRQGQPTGIPPIKEGREQVVDIRSICFGVGDRFTIPQWEHTQHNGFAEVIKIGVGYRLGKILIRWPDLSESWDSTRPSTGLGYGFRDGTYEFLVRGQGVVGPIRDFWVVGEMEYKYCKNWDRLMGRERRFCGRSN